MLINQRQGISVVVAVQCRSARDCMTGISCRLHIPIPGMPSHILNKYPHKKRSDHNLTFYVKFISSSQLLYASSSLMSTVCIIKHRTADLNVTISQLWEFVPVITFEQKFGCQVTEKLVNQIAAR